MSIEAPPPPALDPAAAALAAEEAAVQAQANADAARARAAAARAQLAAQHTPPDPAVAEVDALHGALEKLSSFFSVVEDPSDDRKLVLTHKGTGERFTFWVDGSNSVAHPETVAQLLAYAQRHPLPATATVGGT